MEKIYDLVNRGNGTFTRCSEKHLVDWVARGFEVEGFSYDESFKEALIKPGFLTNIKEAKRPHLSSNYVEYFSSLNPPKKKI
ncbi:hypothetical protein EHS13_33290 [Paenibacillus psychroresistens]|uniref:Uncharacterized protein n=1 Tax=Paenibacillus psychroresistens TaxID=1778678 RepID=A0A6B8RUA6_9BACL|nr:hypothetical protein [Paenibacillus psychroresistens]QGQ99392.1 hypothetical protein EHS13_33290 [Paenibacillus psychroresistens]